MKQLIFIVGCVPCWMCLIFHFLLVSHLFKHPAEVCSCGSPVFCFLMACLNKERRFKKTDASLRLEFFHQLIVVLVSYLFSSVNRHQAKIKKAVCECTCLTPITGTDVT